MDFAVRVRKLTVDVLVVLAFVAGGSAIAAAQAANKPNILFIMADDIGLMQVGVYHRGWALGVTPNIDRIGRYL